MSVSHVGAAIFAVGLGVAVISGSAIASADPADSSATQSGGAQSSASPSDAAPKSESESEPESTTVGSESVGAEDDSAEGDSAEPRLDAEPVTEPEVADTPAVDGSDSALDEASGDAPSANADHDVPSDGDTAIESSSGVSVAVDDDDVAALADSSDSPRSSSGTVANTTQPQGRPAVANAERPKPLSLNTSAGPTQSQEVQALPAAASPAPTTSLPTAAVVAVAPLTRAPLISAVVNVVTQVVTGLLSFVGLGPVATGPTQPPVPPTLLGLFEIARRQFQQTFLNQTPTAQPVQLSQTVDGVVTGTVGALDHDQDQLLYSVIQNPISGSVVVGSNGRYTYTPTAAFAATGGTDTFTVLVDDNTRLHLHLFDGTGRIAVPVIVTVTPPTAQTATVVVGDTPSGIAVDPNGTRAFVTNLESNTVSVIDTRDNDVTATITVGSAPIAVAIGPDGSRAYVANFGADTVSVIDTDANTVLATVAVGDSPAALAVNPGGTRAYVVNGSSDTVSVIDTATNVVVATIAVGRTPNGVAVSPDGSAVFVTNFADKTVSVIDAATNTVVFSPTFGGAPSAIAVSPDGQRAYITNVFTNTVTVVDTASAASTVIGVGGNPNAIAVSPSGARVFVANSADNTVSVIDTATRAVVDTIEVGNTPDAVAVNPIGALVYVANSNDNTVSVIPVVADASRAPAPAALPPLGSTRGLEVFNLTSQTLTLVDYRTDNRADKGGPPIGTTIQPGHSLRFEVVYRFLITDQIVQPTFSGPDGAQYNVFLQVGPFGGPGTGCTVSGGNGQQCSPTPNGPDLIAGSTVKLLDKPGTVVEFGPGQAQDQAKVLNNLCYQDSQASCTFKANRQIDTFGFEKPLVSDLENQSFTETVVRSLTLSDTRTESDSVKVTVKASRSFLDKIVNLEIAAEYGHTWTFTHTFTEQITIRQPPRTIGGINSTQPVFRVFGDFTLNVGNTTFILRDVFFDTPNPDRTGRYQVTERPLDNPAGDTVVFDVEPDAPSP